MTTKYNPISSRNAGAAAVFSQRLRDMPADVLFTAIASRPYSDWTAITYAAPFALPPQGPVYFTNDRSRHWSTLSDNPHIKASPATHALDAGISCILRDKDRDQTLYLCNRNGILKTTDHGKSYSLVYNCSPDP